MPRKFRAQLRSRSLPLAHRPKNLLNKTYQNLQLGSASATATVTSGGGSFGVVGSLILTMLSNEEELLHTTKLIVDAHPAVVNSRDPETGQSLLQFVIAHANRNRLIDLLLSAQCRIGLQADSRGRTCLHVALEQGKWHALQQLLDALQAERFSVIPGSMRLVAECFEAIANDYPRDFLHYIGNLPLQTEPEVLGDIEAFDVMLPSTLICGSSQRCPKGIWTSKLTQYSAARDNQQSMAEHASTSSFAAPTLERSSTASFDRNSLPAEGVRSVQVVCPGFAADCLETLEEIGVENRDYFLHAGGEHYQYIPCLNSSAAHIDALRQVALDALGDWVASPVGRASPRPSQRPLPLPRSFAGQALRHERGGPCIPGDLHR